MNNIPIREDAPPLRLLCPEPTEFDAADARERELMVAEDQGGEDDLADYNAAEADDYRE